LKVAGKLVDLGADVSQRCRWTDMTALHYAAFFDVAPIVNKLLMTTKVVKF
jgi:CAP-Gly domain-containing linker protein 3/4